jgi:hypothetical protein
VPVLSQLLNAGRNNCPERQLHSWDVPREGSTTKSEIRRSLIQSQWRATLASHLSPTGPALRANPFPEVTDLICRLPLPTLSIRLEAIHLGDLLRMWVRSGRKIIKLPRLFQGTNWAHRTPQEPWCFVGTTLVSRGKPIPRGPSLNKKRKLLPGPSQWLGVSFALPRLTPKGSRSPWPGWGILTPFPFGCPQAYN